MMKKTYIKFSLFILIFISLFLCACKKEEDQLKKESAKLPQSLEQVEELAEEIVNSTMKKDWAKSTQKVKELHSKWNEFYPDIQKKGLAKDKIDAFNADLNELTSLLISKTLSISKKDLSEGSVKEQQNQNQSTSQEDQTQNKQNEQGSEPSQEQNDEDQGKNREQEVIDPRQVIVETAPLAIANEGELIIINASINVTKHIPVFMSLFEDNVPPDALKLKYLIRHIDISSELQKWDIASKDMAEALETWIYVQPKVIELKDTLGIQIQQSLTELSEVVSQKNATLIHIKSDVVLKNLETMIDEFKKQ